MFDIDEPLPRQLYDKIAAGGRDDARIAVPAAVDALPTDGFYVPAGFTF